jgi:hypothetical protein
MLRIKYNTEQKIATARPTSAPVVKYCLATIALLPYAKINENGMTPKKVAAAYVRSGIVLKNPTA